MRTLRFLLQKEFRQIFRNPSILRIIFVMPMIQLLVLPWAADYEVKGIHIAVVDHDHSTWSMRLINKIGSSGYFQLVEYGDSYPKAIKQIEKDKADLILEIPLNFERTVINEDQGQLFMAVNAINGVKASLGSAYLQSIINDFNRMMREQLVQFPRFNPETMITVSSSNWFNPYMNYKYFMVPGILVVLITMVGSFLTAMNIVKEKEIGTIEQINVTPVKKYQFILGKLIPFWILGLIVLSIGLLISRLAYSIVPAGSLLTIYIFSAVYLLAILGLGLLISTFTSSQQQAMLISFFLMMVFILLGGLYTSIDSMPAWAQWITRVNPLAYFIDVMRMVVLKGSSLFDIRYHLLIMGGFALILNGWAVVSYRKRS
jgi:ABC-2 type transport system permease protein